MTKAARRGGGRAGRGQIQAARPGMDGCCSAASAKSDETFMPVVAVIYKERNTFFSLNGFSEIREKENAQHVSTKRERSEQHNVPQPL